MSVKINKLELFEKMERKCNSVDNVADISISHFNKDLSHTSPVDVNWILMCAIQKRCFKIVRYFVRAGIKVGRLDESTQTAIHIAREGYMTEQDRQEVLDLLFNIYDHLNYTNDNKLSHFHMACENGNVDMIQRFIDQGVDINLRIVQEFSEDTPLHRATSSRRIEAIHMMLSNGADPNGRIFQDLTLLNCMCWQIAVISPESFILFYLSTIRMLLQYGSDVNTQDDDGNSPILNLFQWQPDVCTSQLITLQMLLQYNADVRHVNNKGETVLHLVLRWKVQDEFDDGDCIDFKKSCPSVIEAVKMLLRHGANVNAQDNDGNTPLNVAVTYCNYDAVEILLEHGAYIGAVNFQGGLLKSDSRTLRNLEMTQNLLAIIELLRNKGFFMLHHHKLTVMQFLNGFDEIDQTLFLPDQIELGTIDRFIDGNEDVCFLTKEDKVYKSIKRYLDLIRIGQMYLDPAIHNYLQEKLQTLTTNQNYNINEKKIEDCFAKAKNTMIHDSLSLLDLCVWSLSKTYQLLEHYDYSSVVNSNDFKENFQPIDGIIKGHITQSLIRGFFEQVAREANLVQLLTQMCLPYLCCENILKHLDNKTILLIYKQYIHKLQTDKC